MHTSATMTMTTSVSPLLPTLLDSALIWMNIGGAVTQETHQTVQLMHTNTTSPLLLTVTDPALINNNVGEWKREGGGGS